MPTPLREERRCILGIHSVSTTPNSGSSTIFCYLYVSTARIRKKEIFTGQTEDVPNFSVI